MARFGFVGPSYSSQSLNADAQKTLNWYVEQIESGQGKSAMAMYPTPGLALFCALGGASRGAWDEAVAYNTGDTVTYVGGTYMAIAPSVGIPPASDPTHWFAIPSVTTPVRGIFAINGRVFAVGGAMLFEVLVTGNSIAWGAVENDGLAVSMAASPSQLLIASGGAAYVFNLSQNTLTQIETFTTNGIQVSIVGFCDGFFLAAGQLAAVLRFCAGRRYYLGPQRHHDRICLSRQHSRDACGPSRDMALGSDQERGLLRFRRSQFSF